MMSDKLYKEARSFYDECLAEKRAVPMPWAVNEIVKRHKDISGDDSEWYTDCAFVAVWTAVSQVVRAVKASEDGEDDESQADLFPGYKRLQKRYVVTRDNIQVTVPVELLTDDEIDAKISEHRMQAIGHELHAVELQRFKDERAVAV